MANFTVKDLIERLKEYPQNYHVILSKDSEGNEFSPLDEAHHNQYVADNAWSGHLFDGELKREQHPNCVVLWPKR